MQTTRLPAARDVVAPDGSDVRVLLATGGASLAHFELAPGQTSVAVVHSTIDELWYFLCGRGEMWRKPEGQEGQVVEVGAGVCLTIPVGTEFQFRARGTEPLSALGVATPPWPHPHDEEEATLVDGPWEPTVEPGKRWAARRRGSGR